MDIIPAIDVKGGNCVRLYQGKREKETIYSQDPIQVAMEWERRGAGSLHVVDLDGAFAGKPQNRELILQLRKAVHLPVQLGGGIRSYEGAKEYLEEGIDRVILSTMVLKDRQGVKRLLDTYGERIMVGLDCKDETLYVEGWVKEGKITPIALAKELEGLGIKTFIITDISRDGTLQGPNRQLLKEFLSLQVSIIASGGVSSLEDLILLKDLKVKGVIIGQALYKGELTLDLIKDGLEGRRGDG